MSIYGALYAGVAGLQAQSNKLAIISDNIANVNTVGYKAGSADFEALVTSASGQTAYSPGGVLGGNQQLIDTQGQLETTTSPTDIAISGGGFFVVNTATDQSGQVEYTRAGSFTQNSTGNFVNSAGLYLQAWPLDRNGNLPGAPGNLDTTSSANLSSLTTVNVEGLTGTAAATTDVSIGANLQSTQIAEIGASGDATMDPSDTLNKDLSSTDIIAPSALDDTERGDQFSVSTGSGLTYNYNYGGFTIGRNVSDGASGDSGALSVSSTPQTLGASPFATTNTSNVITVTQATDGMQTGDVVSLSGNTGIVAGIPAADFNGNFVVTVVDANHYQITVADAAGSTTTGGAGTIQATTRPFVGNVLDATNATQPFLGVTGTSGFTAAGLTFTISTAATGTVTFTYTSSSPNSQLGQFNSLNNLADAISDVNGLSARVVNNQLYVGATDGDAAVTFANGSTTGVSGPPVQAGIDWVGELGLSNIASGTNRFSTLSGLAELVNNSTGLSATINNPLNDSDVSIATTDPLDTITFDDRAVSGPLPALAAGSISTTNGSNVVTVTQTSPTGYQTGDIITLDPTGAFAGGGPYNGIPESDFATGDGTGGAGQYTVTVISPTQYTINVAANATSSGATGLAGLTVTPPNNSGSVLAALGLVPSLDGAAFTPQTTGAIGPAYDPTNSLKNMASGAIAPQYSRPITIYDALGTAHNVNVGFLKTGSNTWAVEIYAQPASDVSTSSADGQIASGTLTFNGDGSLRSVSSSLSAALPVNWSNGSAASSVTFDWGTAGQPFGTPNATAIGKTDGMTQFDSDYNVNFVNQNGAPVGQLTGVSIDSNGYIIASYNNGETQKLYKIPLASFTDPDQLQSVSGDAYTQTSGSGEVNLRQSGSSGVGTIASGQLETSNVELADQLTDMIVAQRAYEANTKVISTADQLLNDLDQILQ